MEEEVKCDYYSSLRQALLDYILLDPSERKRLGIHAYPKRFPAVQVRAPVPWHIARVVAQQFIERDLFIGNIILRRLRQLWDTQYLIEFEEEIIK